MREDVDTAGEMARTMLVIGGSGAVGRFLLRRAHDEGQPVLALTRGTPPAWSQHWPGVRWQRGGIPELALAELDPPTLLISAGPLDALAAACASGLPSTLQRVIALSSLSLAWKDGSPNPAERRLVQRLANAERDLRATLHARQVELVLLRPGLIYGAGVDRSLTPLLQFARRWRLLPWPRAARGLRCPVHADDVAAAMLQCAHRRDLAGAALSLPGPECLPFDALLDRLLGALAPTTSRLPVPVPVSLLRGLAAGDGRVAAMAATLFRAGSDQVADAADWQTLALKPRGFRPQDSDFSPWAG